MYRYPFTVEAGLDEKAVCLREILAASDFCVDRRREQAARCWITDREGCSRTNRAR